MRKTGVVLFSMAVGITWLFLLAGVVPAGEYHVGASLICSNCHTMHASEQHEYDGTATSSSWTATAYLLKGDISNTCLTCHDGQSSIPDVKGANAASATWTPRSAGALTTGADTWQDYKGHTLSTATVTAPAGSSATYSVTGGLTCVKCHSGHGVAAQYRNLVLRPGGAAADINVTYTLTTSETTADTDDKDVWINLATYATGASAYYDLEDIQYMEVTSTASPISAWCGGCHTNMHSETGTSPGDGSMTYHPTGGANLGDGTAGETSFSVYDAFTNHVRTLANNHDWTGGGGGTATDATPSCPSCHMAHGNQNAFGLIFMDGTGTVTEEGDGGTAKTLCKQCHTQG